MDVLTEKLLAKILVRKRKLIPILCGLAIGLNGGAIVLAQNTQPDFSLKTAAVVIIGKPPGCPFNETGIVDRDTPCGWPIGDPFFSLAIITQLPYECNPSHCLKPGMALASSIDLAALPQQVYATHDGEAFVGKSSDPCSASGWCNPLGPEKFVVLRSSKYETLYSHLDSWCVTNGAYVTRGTLIGVSDETGVAQGSHLHYEIRQPNPTWTLADYKVGNHPPGTPISESEFYSLVPPEGRNKGAAVESSYKQTEIPPPGTCYQ